MWKWLNIHIELAEVALKSKPLQLRNSATGVFRILSNIYDVAFCDKVKGYFHKKALEQAPKYASDRKS